MAYLIGSADTARFSSSYSLTSTDGAVAGLVNGTQADAIAPVAEGAANILNLYINDWLSQTSLKACIYQNNALVETIIVPSSAGTGVLSIALAGTTTISNSNTYRLALYFPDASPVSFFTDTGGLTLRYDNGSTGGSYTTPVDPLPDGLFDSFNEFYWTIQSSTNFRKTGTFSVETTLSGTVTAATLNGQVITVDSQIGTTVTLTDSDGSITTSGEYDLVFTDDSADPDETITVQVNVYGVAPSNNPLQKDGAALASLTSVEVRVSAGATLAGSQLSYSGTATTDASGNLGNIDLSSTAAADTDPVLLSIRTAAGDSIITEETVGLI